LKCSLFKKPFGTSKTEILCNFEVNSVVQDFCACGDFGFLFLSDGYIGKINTKNEVIFPWIRDINEASSLCYVENRKSCYVVGGAGRCIGEVRLSDGNFSLVLCGSVLESKIGHHFSKTPKIDNNITAITFTEGGIFYWVSAQLNKCFCYKNNDLSVFMGNGRAGYSLSNNPQSCMLDSPSGLTSYKDRIYICDNNHCIRAVDSDGIKIVAGHPYERGDRGGMVGDSLLDSPSKIKKGKHSAYFIDCGKIKSLLFANNMVKEVLSVEGVMGLDVGKNQDIYIIGETKL